MASEAKNVDQTLRLFNFVEKCRAAGVITHRQYEALQGVSARTDPRRLIKLLTAKR